MSAYTITEATVNDVQIIRNVAEATWWPTYVNVISDAQIRYMLDEIYSKEVLTRQIESKEQPFLLLIEDDIAVAFASYTIYEGDNSAFKLHKLYCLPQTQGKGYGKILINKVADITLKNGASKLYLNVNRYNKALSFYLKMGFIIDHEINRPFGDFMLNDYVMVKELL